MAYGGKVMPSLVVYNFESLARQETTQWRIVVCVE